MCRRLPFLARPALLTIALGVAMTADAENARTRIEREPFGQTPQGQAVERFTLIRQGAPEVTVTNYGGYLLSILVPDWGGEKADVVLGYRDLAGYLGDTAYLGAIVGRYANRIARGEFTLGGRRYTLARNNGPNHLHGGPGGFHTKIWAPRIVPAPEGEALELQYVSPDGEEGYPGRLTVTVTYSMTAEGGLKLEYSAVTDAETIVNLTNHAYFNLAGEGSGDVLGHEIQIEADFFTPVDKTLIPNGGRRPVEGTPLDFRRFAAIGARIDEDHPQLRAGGGYDNNFVVRGEPGQLRLAARVREPRSGRILEVLTTQPGLQFYSGNFLDGTIIGKSGRPYGKRSGFCLETQHYPDSPNKPNYPSVVLRPGERLSETTVYRLSISR